MTPTTTASTGFGVFSAAPTSTGVFGSTTPFGAISSASVPFGTSNTATTNNAGGFSFSGTTSNVFQASNPGANFGTSFGQMSAPTGFTQQGTQPMTVFGTNQATPQNPITSAQQAAQAEANRIVTAVTLPLIYRDERDAVLTLFNQLQAKWGVGKGFMAQSGPPVTFTPDNPFCKFKAIAYNALPTNRPEEGFVCLLLNKKADEIKAMTSPSFSELLHKEVIRVQELSVFIDSVNETGNSQCNVVIYVLEKSPSGQARKLTSTELLAALESPMSKNALTNLGVMNMAEKTEFSKTQLEQYLAVPPSGIDPLLWEQAKSDNPDPKRMVPVPMIGFEDLRQRMNSQRELQTGQICRLERMAQEATELERRCEQTRARVDEFRLKQQDMAHRVLNVMVAFEVNRKIGLGIQSEEETLKASLEEILNEMDVLNRGKLNELQASVKSIPRLEPQAATAEPVSEEVNELLMEQHRGISDLIKVMKEDMKKLDEIKKALTNPNPSI
ncbi:nuclear pore complex protein Nup54-like [Tropilaelaps mercedesae]|uniref:Nuclear pore complex protein Nup54-like n=1 Tax=Tropilaelaps mercedesae TaxID=418985 RepID=A0A1V9XBV1_9ACAR|nr:nuclear pore complex protein Nup54-like [Tropilaelaps mercedesae]